MVLEASFTVLAAAAAQDLSICIVDEHQYFCRRLELVIAEEGRQNY
jgi:hypothetical protein